MSSALIDLLKDIPLSAVLKEKIAGVEAKSAELEIKASEFETQIEILQVKIRDSDRVIDELQAEIENLQRRLTEVTTPTPKLEDKAELLLKAISEHDATTFSVHNFSRVELKKVEFDYYWEDLKTRKFLDTRDNIYFTLSQKGRKYAMDNLSEIGSDEEENRTPTL